MKPVLIDKDAKVPKECYYMYRDCCLEKDRQIIRDHNLRFDITVIPPAKIGCEWMKTFGHYHPYIKNQMVSYPEVYAVLHGKARYLLQKGDGKVVEDFIVIRAKAGDKIIMPPNYGHVTVNPGDQPLVMANWVSSVFSSEYGEIEHLNGFGWFDCIDGFHQNTAYDEVSPIRKVAVRRVPEFALNEEPMYSAGIKDPQKLEYLNHPQKFTSIFENLII